MKIKITPKRLIFFQLYFCMLIKLIIQIIPQLDLLEYLIDGINVILLFFLVFSWAKGKRRMTKAYKTLQYLIVIMLLYDVIRAIITPTNIALFAWGIRNQYRFLLLLLAVCTFWEIEDLYTFLDKCYYILILNFFVIIVQFIMGYRRDYLGGTFGCETNCNAVTNVFLVIMVTYGLLGTIYKRVPIKKTLIILCISMLWAALAELKVFYIELVIIAGLSFLLIRGHSLSKMKLFVPLLAFFILGVGMLFVVFPEQLEFVTNISSIIWYIQNVQGGAYGFGRITAIDITNRVFFENEILPRIIGIGVGNAEFMNAVGLSITSTFYNKYAIYSYFGYFHSMVYIERGIIGLAWYVLIWMNGLILSIRMRKVASYKTIAEFSIIFLIILVLLALKDSTLRISTSGYIVSVFMAVPYLIEKARLRNNE